MMTTDFRSIHLRRVDPARRMARFYLVTVEVTLFGEAIIRRCWGRIGTRGQTCAQVVRRGEDAERFADQLATRKRRRGYRDVS